MTKKKQVGFKPIGKKEKTSQLSIVMRNINELIPADYNPRQLSDKEYKDIEESLSTFGMVDPIIVNKHPDRLDIIVGGHQRVKVCRNMDKTEVPTVEVRLNLEEERELNVRLNKNTGSFDMELLEVNFDTEDLVNWGFDEEDFKSSIELDIEEDIFEPAEDIKTDIVLGDLIEIGKHRLLCGDSTDSDQVDKLMDGEKSDMVFTDPPYLMGFGGGMQTNENGNWTKSFNSKHGKIKNDKMKSSEEKDFLDAINSNIQIFNKGAFYICFYRLGLGSYFASLERTGLKVRTLITWNKGNHTLSNSDYWSKCEHIFYGWVDEHNFYGKNDFDIWEIARTKKNDLHPTMKPIPLCEKVISNSSKIKDIVLDLFLGSGSTMVAAHQLKRKCYGMELTPKYCQGINSKILPSYYR